LCPFVRPDPPPCALHAEHGGTPPQPILDQFAERLLATGLPKKAVICAVMHKLTHLIYGVIRTGQPFGANYLAKRLAIQDGI
jgi:transposase